MNYSIFDNSEIQYEICKKIDDAIKIGEENSSCTYHILVSKKTGIICLVYHYSYMSCEFCKLETDELMIFI